MCGVLGVGECICGMLVVGDYICGGLGVGGSKSMDEGTASGEDVLEDAGGEGVQKI